MIQNKKLDIIPNFGEGVNGGNYPLRLLPPLEGVITPGVITPSGGVKT